MTPSTAKPGAETNLYRITSGTHIPEIIPVITIRSSVFAIRGDISFVTGQAKAGKTQTVIPILATALMENVPPGLDTLDIYATWCGGRPVVYVDTEQPPAYTYRTLRSVMKLLGTDREPANLHCYNLRRQSRDEKLRLIKAMMHEMPTAHVWVIDGIADCVNDVNDTKESFRVIDEFMSLAETLNTTIVLYLHENPGTAKLRGNLGSEAERKCGGAITVRKDREKGLHFIEARILRGSVDFEPIACTWSNEHGRLVKADEMARLDTDAYKDKTTKLHELAVRVFEDPAPVAYAHLLHRVTVMDDPQRAIGTTTAKRRIQELVKAGLVLRTARTYSPGPSLKSTKSGDIEGPLENLVLFEGEAVA